MANIKSNFKRIVCALLIVVSVILFAVGCASDKGNATPPEGAETVTVTFMVDGEVYKTEEIFKGGTIGDVEDPKRDATDKVSYSFAGWYTDADYFDYFDADTTVRADMTLYAKFNENAIVTTGMAALYALIGFIIVLAVLAVLVGIFYLLGAVFNSKKLKGKSAKQVPATTTAVASSDDEEELVAAITAAVTAVLSEESGDVAPEFVIRRVKRKA